MCQIDQQSHKNIPSKNPTFLELIGFLEIKWLMNSCKVRITSRNFDYTMSTLSHAFSVLFTQR